MLSLLRIAKKVDLYSSHHQGKKKLKPGVVTEVN